MSDIVERIVERLRLNGSSRNHEAADEIEKRDDEIRRLRDDRFEMAVAAGQRLDEIARLRKELAILKERAKKP
jgi:hypothetical protein